LRHRLTGEIVTGAGEASLGFSEVGRGFVESMNSSVWVVKLLKYHVFKLKPVPGSDRSDRSFVFHKPSNDRQWLEDFQKQRMILYPRSFLRGPWSGMVSIISTRQDKRYYWLLRPFTKANVILSKKLKQQWLPSFCSKVLNDERGPEDDVLWSQNCKMPAASDAGRSPMAHDICVSTRLFIYILVLLSAQKNMSETKATLQEYIMKLLPDRVQVHVNNDQQGLTIEKGRLSLSEITARRVYQDRQKGCRRKITRSLGEEKDLADVLVDLWRWRELCWLFTDILQAIVPHIESGVSVKGFDMTPLESDCFDFKEPDWRDPNVRQARLAASLVSREKKKAQRSDEPQGVSAKRKDKKRTLAIQAAVSKSLVNSRHKRQERSQRLQSVRRGLSNALRVHIAFDGSRVGGRKRVTFAVMDGRNGLSCWAPPVRFRDCGYRSPDQAPTAQEQQQLDKRTLEFLAELRTREQVEKPTQVCSNKLTSSLARLVGLHVTVSQWSA
jgi:hypothetical protein